MMMGDFLLSAFVRLSVTVHTRLSPFQYLLPSESLSICLRVPGCQTTSAIRNGSRISRTARVCVCVWRFECVGSLVSFKLSFCHNNSYTDQIRPDTHTRWSVCGGAVGRLERNACYGDILEVKYVKQRFREDRRPPCPPLSPRQAL